MSDETTVFFPRRLVKQFILKYQELECLWNRECTAYKLKKKRHEAITQLTQLVQTYDPAATRVHILRKIDSLRACVRREYKKVTDSRQIAKRDRDVYIPQLWYYKLFSFLIPQDESEHEKDKVLAVRRAMLVPEDNGESSDDETEDDRASSPQSEDVKPEPTYEANCAVEYSPATVPRESRVHPEARRKRTRPREGITGVDDEYDAIGMNVAAKLRYLPDNMRILAEKLISDVLFQAQTNGLTAASVLVTPDPFH